jgi:hypothetical protein
MPKKSISIPSMPLEIGSIYLDFKNSRIKNEIEEIISLIYPKKKRFKGSGFTCPNYYIVVLLNLDLMRGKEQESQFSWNCTKQSLDNGERAASLCILGPRVVMD